ncbi:hypothetical protein [Methanobrevibacter ruminantium]|uniref:hypothetical protein n=1 Tax=Methanobrevibacter ruminantium TaxID=83816 RepID=UPI002D7E6F5B|nr:hypothetical protein [Methanobrevibacter ruminantium]
METEPIYIKEVYYKRIRQILTKRLFYLPLVYLLVNIGFILSLFFPKDLHLNIYVYPLIFLVLPYSCFFLQRIHANFFQKKDDNFNEKFFKIYFIIGYSVMIFLPVLISFYTFICFKNDLTFNYFIIFISYSFVTSLIFNNILKYRLLIEYPENVNELILKILLLLGIVISVFIMSSPQIIITITNMLNLNLSEIGTLTNIAIAVVVLCATLSALSFTYCSTLKNNNGYYEMKKNGEGYFISTILSMILLILIYISSLMSHVINLTNLFRLNLIEYFFINIYSISLIFSVSLVVYVIYYMITSSFSTLKILGFIK